MVGIWWGHCCAYGQIRQVDGRISIENRMDILKSALNGYELGGAFEAAARKKTLVNAHIE